MSIKLGPYEQSSLILIRTITPLHIGVGRVIGAVDLPIQRDGLGFPLIPSSSLKGMLRAYFRSRRGNQLANILFGASPEEKETYVGSLAIGEGYLLAMPARSLKGIYALVTSPFLMRRFSEVAEISGNHELRSKIDKILKWIGDLKNQILTIDPEKFAVKGRGVLINEEFELKAVTPSELCKEYQGEFDDLARILLPEEPWRLTVINDDIIRDVIDRSILRRSRIRLKGEEKVVKEGGLWTEEDVPTDAIFYVTFHYSRVRKRLTNEEKEEWKEISGTDKEDAEIVKRIVENELFPKGKGYIVFGGHETIGRGIAELRLYHQEKCL